MILLDKIDEKILSELIKDAKIPLRKLSKKMNISFVTVMNRIKKMESNGVIEKYRPKINYEKLGYEVNVMVEIRISNGKLFELEKKIAKLPGVFAVYDTTGDFDATIFARFKSTRTLDTFIKKVQTFDFVERTQTKLILNTIKNEMSSLNVFSASAEN